MAYSKYPPKLYTPGQTESFKLSRSKIDFYYECPRCFYLDRRFGVSRPSIPSFTLNSAVDALFKKEFDLLRAKGEAHELMKHYHIDAIPFKHPKMDEWRENFVGVQYLHPATNFTVFGAVDDIWVEPSGRLLVVDYKSTSTDREISLDDQYKQGYKRQMEIYQWLLTNNGFEVSPTGYFVFANASKNKPSFDGKLEFELSIIPYTGNGYWIEQILLDIKTCLDSDKLPNFSPTCEYCQYTKNRLTATRQFQTS